MMTTRADGLRICTIPMNGVETATLMLLADCGSRHEPEALNGIAHLFEHMVFKGAAGRSAREISEAIEDVGGELNACTERDGTSFHASVLAEHVPLGVELLADLALRPHLSAEELSREKQVVLQELAEARDTPSDIIFDAAMRTCSSVTEESSAAISAGGLTRSKIAICRAAWLACPHEVSRLISMPARAWFFARSSSRSLMFPAAFSITSRISCAAAAPSRRAVAACT